MNALTYPEAYNKIIEAYFKDEIKPYDAEFCFCGTLAYNPESQFDRSKDFWENHNYSNKELDLMESALLNTIKDQTIGGNDIYFMGMGIERTPIITHPNYENALFAGMSAALDVLKEIHRSRGENVDEDIPAFTKRELAKTDIEVVVNN